MTILCVDPGFGSYGCAIIDAKGKPIKLGTLTTEASKKKSTRVSDDKAFRIAQLTSALAQIIKANKIQGVLGEMPSAGGQSARAISAMAIATAVSVSVFTLFKLPVEWVSPIEVKKAMTGHQNASKVEMMERACELYGWEIQKKEIYTKKTGKLKRVDNIYFPLGKKTPANKFEHIADSLGAYEALKESNIVRMFVKP